MEGVFGVDEAICVGQQIDSCTRPTKTRPGELRKQAMLAEPRHCDPWVRPNEMQHQLRALESAPASIYVPHRPFRRCGARDQSGLSAALAY